MGCQLRASKRSVKGVIGQCVGTDRNPELYAFPCRRRNGVFTGSALFAYRLNWQTVFFLGYDDNRALDGAEVLQPSAFKVSLSVPEQAGSRDVRLVKILGPLGPWFPGAAGVLLVSFQVSRLRNLEEQREMRSIGEVAEL